MVSDPMRRATRSAEVEGAAGADGDPATTQLLGDHGLELVGIGRRGPRPPAVVEQADGDAVLGLAVTAVHHGPGLDGDRTLVVLGELAAREGVDLVLEVAVRSEEHTSELQSLMRISNAVFCVKKKK